MTEAVLRLDHMRKSFGGLHVTDGVSLAIRPGEMHALIGPNGAGKTTLIHQISGLILPDSGSVVFCGMDVTGAEPSTRARCGLARSFQITSIFPGFTALENVALAVQARSGSSFRFFRDAATDPAFNGPAMDALAEVNLDGRAGVLAARMSHGEKRALELAMALAMEPKLLLLDEPMAGTGPEETDRLVSVLTRLKGRFPMLLVEHDMKAVFALADRISVLIYGRILTTGTPSEVRNNPEVIAAYLGDEME
ncbi:Lipopolysaccharide export system ATP-binding protein LptB [compost metagenome]